MSRAVSITAMVTFGLFLGSLFFAGWCRWEVLRPGGWRDEVKMLGAGMATDEAINDFRAGRLRLYAMELHPGRERFSGQRDGDFEICFPAFFPELGWAHRYSTEQYIKYYNRKMRSLAESQPAVVPADE